MIVAALGALGLFVLGAGFVLGIAYGVREESRRRDYQAVLADARRRRAGAR